MTESLEELRKSVSLLKEVSVKARNILGVLPGEVDTLLEDAERELVSLEEFDREAKTTWTLHPRKRRLEKLIKSGIPKISERISKALHLLTEPLHHHFDELLKIQNEILAFDMKLGRQLSTLTFPPTEGEASQILEAFTRFVSNFETVYIAIRDTMIKQVTELLEQNRALTKTYDRFIGIDKSDIPISAERESVAGFNIVELLKIRKLLRKEHDYLTSRRGEIVKTMQAKLRSSIESTLSLIETARSLRLKVSATISTQLKGLLKHISKDINLTNLLGLVQQYDGQLDKASSQVRRQLLEFEHDLNNILSDGGVSLDASFLPSQPELSQDDSLASLITRYERLQTHQTNIETALRRETMRILDELERVIKGKDFAIAPKLASVKSAKTKARREKLKSLVVTYSKVAAWYRDEHGKLLSEMQVLEDLLSRVSDAANTLLDKTALGSELPPRQGVDLSFSEMVTVYVKLKKYVQSRIDLFRKAWEGELNELLAEIQIIKPAYRESFKTMEEFLQATISKLRPRTTFEEIEAITREVRGDALYKAQDSIEQLKYRLDLKLRLTLSRLTKLNLAIPPEIQDAIRELGVITPASETYEEAIRKAQSIVELFELRIVGHLNQILREEVKAVSDLIAVSNTLGINTKAYAKQLIQLQEQLPATISDIADRFDELQLLVTSPKFLSEIRHKGDELWRNLSEATTLLERYDSVEIVENLRGLLSKVPEQLGTDSIHSILEICLALIEAQDSVLDIIRNLERKTHTTFEQSLETSTEYYSTIQRVFQKRPKEFSTIIFSLDALEELRQRFAKSDSLSEAIDIFSSIRHMEAQWMEKVLEIDKWHKALRVFLADYNPSAPKTERNRQLDEIERRIQETYSREDTASYLAWAARELAAVMEKQRSS